VYGIPWTLIDININRIITAFMFASFLLVTLAIIAVPILMLILWVEKQLPEQYRSSKTDIKMPVEMREWLKGKKKFVIACLGLPVYLFFIYSCGRSIELGQIDYLVPADNPRCIVVQMTSANYVCTAYDSDTNRKTNKFEVHSIGDNAKFDRIKKKLQPPSGNDPL
jgi:hypothetical protein